MDESQMRALLEGIQGRQYDEVWSRLVHGELPEAEARALQESPDPEVRRLYELFRPLGPQDRARFEQVVGEVLARRRQERLYELTGDPPPSPRHTLEAADVRVARLACWLIGHGLYGLRSGAEDAMPILTSWGDVEILEWVGAQIGEDLALFRGERAEAVAAALESVQPAGELREEALRKARWFRGRPPMARVVEGQTRRA